MRATPDSPFGQHSWHAGLRLVHRYSSYWNISTTCFWWWSFQKHDEGGGDYCCYVRRVFPYAADSSLTLCLGFTTSTCSHPAGRLCTTFYAIFYAKVLPIARFAHDWLPTSGCARDISYCMISSTHWPHCITQDYLCLLRLRVSQSSSLQSLDLLRHPLHLHCISISSFCKVLHAQSQLWERRAGICFRLVSAQNIAKIVPRLDRSWTLPS